MINQGKFTASDEGIKRFWLSILTEDITSQLIDVSKQLKIDTSTLVLTGVIFSINQPTYTKYRTLLYMAGLLNGVDLIISGMVLDPDNKALIIQPSGLRTRGSLSFSHRYLLITQNL